MTQIQHRIPVETITAVRDDANKAYRRVLRTSQLASAALAAQHVITEYPDAAYLELDESDLDDGFMGGRILDRQKNPLTEELFELDICDDVQDLLYDLPQRKPEETRAFEWFVERRNHRADHFVLLDLDKALQLSVDDILG